MVAFVFAKTGQVGEGDLFAVGSAKTERVGEGALFAFLPKGKNSCSHQCLHWWQQYATGILHLHYSSPAPKAKEKDILSDVLFFWWARRDLNPHVRSEH